MERVWVEVNSRVNYSLKEALNDLVEANAIDLDDEAVKFSVSWVTMRVARAGLRIMMDAFNNRRIPGK